MKPRVHIKTFAGCEGCQDRLAHSDWLVPLLGALDLVECRLLTSPVDQTILPGDIVIFEGSPTLAEHISLLKEIREISGVIIIAMGTCAATGGVPAGMPKSSAEEANAGLHGEYIKSLEVRPGAPLSHYIKVDAFIRACPINPDEFVGTVVKLLVGGKPIDHKHAVCAECERVGCLLNEGEFCAGALSVSGCQAVCPSVNRGCLACRGFVSNTETEKFLAVLESKGFEREDVLKKLSIYNAYALGEAKNV